MENLDEKKLFFKNIIIELERVEYKKNNNQYNNGMQINIVTKDSYDISDISINGFKMFYQRHVELDPKILFDVTVVYGINYEFDTPTKNEYKNDLNSLSELIKIKAEKAINMSSVVPRASALISSITMQNNGNSIITPPNYIKS